MRTPLELAESEGWDCSTCSNSDPGSYVYCKHAYTVGKPGCTRNLTVTITDLEALEELASLRNLPNPENPAGYIARLINQDRGRYSWTVLVDER